MKTKRNPEAQARLHEEERRARLVRQAIENRVRVTAALNDVIPCPVCGAGTLRYDLPGPGHSGWPEVACDTPGCVGAEE